MGSFFPSDMSFAMPVPHQGIQFHPPLLMHCSTESLFLHYHRCRNTDELSVGRRWLLRYSSLNYRNINTFDFYHKLIICSSSIYLIKRNTILPRHLHETCTRWKELVPLRTCCVSTTLSTQSQWIFTATGHSSSISIFQSIEQKL